MASLLEDSPTDFTGGEKFRHGNRAVSFPSRRKFRAQLPPLAEKHAMKGCELKESSRAGV
jgi:hypothetical protein